MDIIPVVERVFILPNTAAEVSSVPVDGRFTETQSVDAFRNLLEEEGIEVSRKTVEDLLPKDGALLGEFLVSQFTSGYYAIAFS